MNHHEKTLKLITALDYNSRQVSRVLGISIRGADKKMKQEGSNKFLESDFKQFQNFIKQLYLESK